MATREKKLTVMASEKELDIWKEAAHVRRTTLSDWARRVLTATAEETMRKAEEPA